VSTERWSENPADVRIPHANLYPSSSTLVRWAKFNLVGAIGIGVQFAALFLLKSVAHLNYLVATAIAVETAVLHNFIWHERFTWADRIIPTTNNVRLARTRAPDRLLSSGFFRRLWRFHLANGVVSIAGNVVVMKILVDASHLNYLAANAVAIAVCSLANFLLSDQWVFES
jgi:putative flippase GtrA